MAKDGVESHPEILRIQMTDVASISGFVPMKFRQNRVRLFLAGRGMPRYDRGLAVVAQDNVRRAILKEVDRPGAVNVGLIEQVVRYSLDHGYHVVLASCTPTTTATCFDGFSAT